MLRSEKGFVLPVTMVISFLFFMVFSHQLNQFILERKFSRETEEFHTLERVMQMAVADVKIELDMLSTVPSSSTKTVSYQEGAAHISIRPLSTRDIEVNISCSTLKGGKGGAILTYSLLEKQFTKWFENR